MENLSTTSRHPTPEVTEISKINFTGNVIPINWYKTITNDYGKPDIIAITLLSEIVYWYRQTIVRDEETGNIVEVRKKFKYDKLQRSASSLASQFGFSKRQVEEALRRLKKMGLITLELRVIKTENAVLSNVPFIGIIPKNVEAVTYNMEGGVTEKCITPPLEKGGRIHRLSTENSTNNIKHMSSHDDESAKVTFQQVADSYNHHLGDRLPSCMKINEARKRAIKKFLKLLLEPTIECVDNYFNYFAQTAGDFYFGKSGGRWKADFDYLIKEKTFIKVKEGNIGQ